MVQREAIMARVQRSRIDTSAARPRRVRRLLRLLLLVVGLVLVLVGGAPVLIAHTTLLNRIVAAAASDLQGSVHIGHASLNWFSAPVLEDVEVRDAEGKPIVSVGRVAGGKTLLGLVLD